MEFEPFAPDVEVNGRTVQSVVDGFGAFTVLAARYLLAEQVGEPTGDGRVVLEPGGWYPQAGWLRAFRMVAAEIGETVLFNIGEAIPRNAEFPPGVRDVRSAVAAIDVAYHMNHRRGGRPMFDPLTGRLEEGIGHYGCKEVPGERTLLCECWNPYPCAFDEGIVSAMVKRFEPGAHVTHDPTSCRHKGGDRCVYRVSW